MAKKAPPVQKYPLRLPVPLYRAAVKRAEAEHRSLNSLLIVAVAAYLNPKGRD